MKLNILFEIKLNILFEMKLNILLEMKLTLLEMKFEQFIRNEVWTLYKWNLLLYLYEVS